MSHPYEQLPDHQFWRRAVAMLPPAAVDPIAEVPFRISATDKVATAGSCFAQNLAPALRARGLNYYVAESAPAGLTPDEAWRRNYGRFSCRFGNIYTARQLLQTMRRAYGRLAPDVDAWTTSEGRFVDPFRPTAEPDGFATLDALHADRASHLESVRRMMETLDVLIFTMGLTECWQTRGEGAVVPLAPGVAGGTFDPNEFVFCNPRAGEIAADLLAFADELAAINARAKVILTVSPQPLTATYRPIHALVANAVTKAALRAAVDEVCTQRPGIAYFPAYEIVTMPGNAMRFFADNQRTVTPLGVAHVMRLFFKHFAMETTAAPTQQIDAAAEAQRLATAACEEDALDPGR